MLIEFLYQRFKTIIYCTLLPLYIASHFCLEKFCSENDLLITEMRDAIWGGSLHEGENIRVQDYPRLVEESEELVRQSAANSLLLVIQFL